MNRPTEDEAEYNIIIAALTPQRAICEAWLAWKEKG